MQAKIWRNMGILTIALCGSVPALAQTQPYLMEKQIAPAPKLAPGEVLVHTGTGFFVSNSGHVITNYHVIQGCTEAMLQGSIPDSMAQVVAVDKEHDLALLLTKARASQIATIRHPGASRLREGEPVLVMGYPLDSFKRREYQLADSTVVGLKGPQDEPKWIQFSDAAQHGNSGGPLLDASGNVAGVVVGKFMQTQSINGGASTVTVRQSDLAISLPILLRFLEKNVVSYRVNSSSTYMMSSRIEQQAKNYIVSVICPQKP